MYLSKLTIKQQKFADEYIISGNATEAAIRAGYSKKTARTIGAQNLTKLNIKSYIDKRLEEIKQEKIADQQEVMEYLTRVLRGEETEKTLINLGVESGQDITDIDVCAKDRIKAAELIGKRYGMWTDKLDLDLDIGVEIIDDIK